MVILRQIKHEFCPLGKPSEREMEANRQVAAQDIHAVFKGFLSYHDDKERDMERA